MILNKLYAFWDKIYMLMLALFSIGLCYFYAAVPTKYLGLYMVLVSLLNIYIGIKMTLHASKLMLLRNAEKKLFKQ